MTSVRTATIVCGLALWVILAVAPLVGACMDQSCALEEGVRSAHCGMPATVMLCCDETPEPPAVASLTSEVRIVQGLPGESRPSESVLAHRDELVAEVALTSHGPPLYDLFAALLI